jgi:hypothetical protein
MRAPGVAGRSGRRLSVLAVLVAALLSCGLLSGTASAAGVPSIAAVANALKSSPVHVAPGAATYQVDAAQVARVAPKATYLAVLPATALPSGVQPDEMPALLSSQLDRGGTVIILLGKDFYGASTTLPGRLPNELATAQAALPATGGDATPTLVSLMRSLAGSGDLQDAQGPSRAGGPISGPVLAALLGLAVIAAFALWWWLRRKPRARRPKAPPRPRDLVEIDHEGVVVRRVPAAEREQHPG